MYYINMPFNEKIHRLQENFFNAFIIVSYTLIILTALGLSKYAPSYLSNLDYYVKIYVCLFLIIRFNPFRKLNFTNLDRKIAFSSGLFILTTTALDKYLIDISNKTKELVVKHLPKNILSQNTN